MKWKPVFLWILGLLVTCLGVIFLVAMPPVGIVLLLVGLYCLPPVNRRVDIDISLSRAVSWVVGLSLILFGIVSAALIPLAGVIAIVGGVFALPVVRKQVTERTRFQFARWVVAAVVLCAGIASMATVMVAVENNESLGQSTEVHSIGERYSVDADDSSLRMTVEEVNKTGVLTHPSSSDIVIPERDAFIVVTVQLENSGNESIQIEEDHLTVVSEDGEEEYPVKRISGRIPSRGPFHATGLDITDGETELDAQSTVTRTIVFDVKTDETYLFTIQTDWPFSDADRHYVPLGKL